MAKREPFYVPNTILLNNWHWVSINGHMVRRYNYKPLIHNGKKPRK